MAQFQFPFPSFPQVPKTSSVKPLYLLTLTLTLLTLLPSSNGKTCPGKCTDRAADCAKGGGKVVGHCVNEQVCCDFSPRYTGSCGTTKKNVSTAIFQSPHYPGYTKGNLECVFRLDLTSFSGSFAGIMYSFTFTFTSYNFLHFLPAFYDRIEYEDVYTEGPGFIPHSPCEADVIFIRGFKYWQPPGRCGNLTGYTALMDKSKNTKDMKTLTILALMSSSLYKWKIKITLIGLQKHSSIVEKTPSTLNRKKPTNLHPRPARNANALLQTFDLEDGESDSLMPEPLIVNGVDTSITEFPWQASLRELYSDDFLKNVQVEGYNDSRIMNMNGIGCEIEGRHFCGGSIISDQHILSAAHCFEHKTKVQDWKDPSVVKVFLGETDLCHNDTVKYGRKTQNFDVEKIIFHYAYDVTSSGQNDLVILKLKEKIKLNSYIKTVALSKRNTDYNLRKVKASGWGLTNLTTQSIKLPQLLQSAEGFWVENKTYCDGHLERNFHSKKEEITKYPKYRDLFSALLCTNSKNDTKSKMMGNGDSGGPLVVFEENSNSKSPVPVQIGVVSFSLPALTSDSEHGNVFVDYFQSVSHYRDWIDLAQSI